VKTLVKRALCAALTLALVPAAPGAAEVAEGSVIYAPASSAVPGRSVLIDASSATLYMLEGGRIVDSMKVIVGKRSAATPELTTSLTYATLNPYWHVPPDIARTLTAPNVLKQGVGYLKARGYEVVDRFGAGAQVVDPKTVDWKAVAEGRERLFVRQRPGPANSMGRMKFSLAAGGGIYLHDTPMKDLFAQENRNLSAGCVRLEDAPRFARWLLGDEMALQASAPELHIALRRQVPITITYLDPQSQTQLASLR